MQVQSQHQPTVFSTPCLSMKHAKVWADKETGKIWIQDANSSKGTFVNRVKLSDSEPHELREQDTLELGIDAVRGDWNAIQHHKVSAKVELAGFYLSLPSLLEMDFIARYLSSRQQVNHDNALLLFGESFFTAAKAVWPSGPWSDME